MALIVDGMVTRTVALEYADLAGLGAQIEDVGTLVPKRRGAAVPLRAVLDIAGVRPGASYLTVTSSDTTFSASVPLEAVLDTAVLVYRHGDGPLPGAMGGPVRLLIPDAASCRTAEIDTCANVKFVGRLHLGAERGEDTRPSTPRDHKALHRKPGHERSK